MNLSKESISKVLSLQKTVKPLIHCILTSGDIGDLSQGILCYNGIPIIAHGLDEVSEITMKSNAVIISLATLDNNKVLAMEKSLKSAMRNEIPVVLDICGANLSIYRCNIAMSLLINYNIDIVKGTSEEVRSLIIAQQNIKKKDQIIEADYRRFARRNRILLLVCSEKYFLTDGYSEFYIRNGSRRFEFISNIQSILTGMIAVGVAIYKTREKRIHGVLVAILSFAIAQDFTIDKVNFNKENVFLKNYLFDEISNMDEEKIFNFEKLYYGFRSKTVS